MAMTEEQLREIEARHEAATPGPWRHTFKDCLYYMSSEFIDREDDPIGVGLITSDINQHNAELYATDADMEFIAHARADIPALLAEVRRLREEQLRKTDCRWCDDTSDSHWLTDCGHAFEFDGLDLLYGPVEHGFRFCPYCGRKLVEVVDDAETVD